MRRAHIPSQLANFSKFGEREIEKVTQSLLLNVFFSNVDVMKSGKKKFQGITSTESIDLALPVPLQPRQYRIPESSRLVRSTLI